MHDVLRTVAVSRVAPRRDHQLGPQPSYLIFELCLVHCRWYLEAWHSSPWCGSSIVVESFGVDPSHTTVVDVGIVSSALEYHLCHAAIDCA